MADLAKRVPQLRPAVVEDAPAHLGDDAFARGVAAQRDDARETELLAIAAVQVRHAQEFIARKAREAKPALLARRVDRERAPFRLGAGELGMRANERQLLVALRLRHRLH